MLGVAAVLISGGLLGVPKEALAQSLPPPRNLECLNIRRLADNFLLDLKIRLIFSRKRHSYVRLENTGRGWHVIAERPYVAIEPTRILLGSAPEFLSYIERLTGDYYHIDYTGTGLSYWGRCILVGGTSRLF